MLSEQRRKTRAELATAVRKAKREPRDPSAVAAVEEPSAAVPQCRG